MTRVGTMTGQRRIVLVLALLTVAVVAAGIARIVHGSTDVPLQAVFDLIAGRPVGQLDRMIIVQLRLPNAVTALLAGAALAVSGSQLQTLFGNPLADPYVLGVSSGATLGVAAVLLLGSAVAIPLLRPGSGFAGTVGTTIAASAGAAAVMALVLGVSTLVRSGTTLLLVGVMIGSLVSAAVMVLLASARPELLADFIAWQFGSYRGTTLASLAILAPVLGIATVAALALAPWLNVLQVGERYAATMGVNVTLVRTLVIAVTAVLAGVTTAYCGPIQFLGMAVPHIARQLLATADQRVLLPATALCGAALACAVDVVTTLPGGAVLPLNAGNAAVGAPIVMWVLLRRPGGRTA